jgi:hypothetical protein
MKPTISNLAWAGMDSEPYYRLLVDWRIVVLEVAPTSQVGGNWSSAFCIRDASCRRKALAAKGITTIGLQSLFCQHPELQLAEGPDTDTDTGTRLVAPATQLVHVCCGVGDQYLVTRAPANRKRCGTSARTRAIFRGQHGSNPPTTGIHQQVGAVREVCPCE